MAKNSKHYFLRGGYIHVKAARGTLERMGANLLDETVYYRRATGLEATDENIAYIQEHALEVLYHLVTKQKASSKEKTFQSFADEYFRHNLTDVTSGTKKEHISDTVRFIYPYFSARHLSNIKHKDVRDWISALHEMDLSADKIRRLRMLFKKLLNEALYEGLIESNPFAAIKPMKKPLQKKKEAYTMDEIALILERATGWLETYLTLSLMTGARPIEVRNLSWKDIDFKKNEITLYRSKTETVDRLPMIFAVEIALKKEKMQNPSSSYLFPSSRTGKPFKESKSIDKHFKVLLEELGIKYKSLQATRHTFASILMSEGMDVEWVSNYMGHSSIETTIKHYKLFMEDKQVKEKIEAANTIFAATIKQKKEM